MIRRWHKKKYLEKEKEKQEEEASNSRGKLGLKIYQIISNMNNPHWVIEY